MPRRYLYGSSADSIASQEMGRDAATSQRFFQSLAAQQAAQNALNDEAYRQSSFQAAERARAEHAAQARAANRLAFMKQQQDWELGQDKLSTQQAIAEGKIGNLSERLAQDRELTLGKIDLGLGKMEMQRELAENRLNYLSGKTNPADVRLQIENDKAKAAEADLIGSVTRYKQLMSQRDELRKQLASLERLPTEMNQYYDKTASRWKPDAADVRRRFIGQAESGPLRYPPGMSYDYVKDLSLKERILQAKPAIKERLEDVDEQLEILNKTDLPMHLNRQFSTGAQPPTFLGPPASLATPPPPTAAVDVQLRELQDAALRKVLTDLKTRRITPEEAKRQRDQIFSRGGASLNNEYNRFAQVGMS